MTVVRYAIVGILFAAFFQAVSAEAGPRKKSGRLIPGKHFTSETEDGACGCVQVGARWLSAVLNEKKGNYKTHNDEIRRLQTVVKQSTNQKKKKKAKKQRQQLVKERKRCAAICAAGPSLMPPPTPGAADPTPTPGQSATPTPIPRGCYDGNRNTSCFGIPAGMVGNEGAGAARWTFSPGCGGCHLEYERRDRTYQEVQAALATVPEMQPLECDAQCIADVVAYLNRYNLNQ